MNEWIKFRDLASEIYEKQSNDMRLISELAGMGLRLIGDGSLRSWDLRRKIKHYQGLKQESAKARALRDIHRVVFGLQSEIANCMPTSVRGGSNAQ